MWTKSSPLRVKAIGFHCKLAMSTLTSRGPPREAEAPPLLVDGLAGDGAAAGPPGTVRVVATALYLMTTGTLIG